MSRTALFRVNEYTLAIDAPGTMFDGEPYVERATSEDEARSKLADRFARNGMRRAFKLVSVEPTAWSERRHLCDVSTCTTQEARLGEVCLCSKVATWSSDEVQRDGSTLWMCDEHQREISLRVDDDVEFARAS